ncbi:hypothetical protein [Nitrococcus mobilis]|uniref:Uncharacterized protein n=1 Tax=Nitrococcus mobilis Nb-231 TaxID=314278 RepID=A4BRQ6_9GAMM|nr:hypothetical protein [Nitrococcus mobilis]EAR21627.1 hypothetical protein NB231_02633 [Nitrococcus mobilis Nb-231]
MNLLETLAADPRVPRWLMRGGLIGAAAGFYPLMFAAFGPRGLLLAGIPFAIGYAVAVFGFISLAADGLWGGKGIREGLFYGLLAAIVGLIPIANVLIPIQLDRRGR